MKPFFILFSALLIVGCGGGQKKQAEASAPRGVYTMPQIPAMITEPEAQARWAAEHFWDNFDFRDTTLVHDGDYTEQAFVDYINLLRNIPRDIAHSSIPVFMTKAAADKGVFLSVAEVAEKYLYDPNSPYRDEDFYIDVLRGVLANPALDRYERIRPEGQLELALKNRPGDRAADFTYTLADGSTGTLYGLRAPFTLLFFNNPGCPACAETMDQINGSPFMVRLMREGTLKILGVYPDENLDEWRDHAGDFLASWINSYDATTKIKNEELYDLRAIPTLYLLDREKRVMLKDVMSVALIEETLNNAIN